MHKHLTHFTVESTVMPEKEPELKNDWDAFKDIGYRVNVMFGKPRINQRKDAFEGFIKNWDDILLSSIKEYRTLVLNDDNRALCQIIFADSGKQNSERVRVLFQLLKGIDKAKKIIVGKNHPFKEIFPDESEKQLAREIVHFGQDAQIPVLHQLIVSKKGFYEFDQQDLAVRNLQP